MKSNDKTEKHLDKANSLLDDYSREEKSGFKAEINSGSDKIGYDASKEEKSGNKANGKFNNGNNNKNGADQKDKDKKKCGSPEQEEEYYNDEFDEIDEDLPPNDDELEASGGDVRPSKIGESHGITVSQSLGIDPSVDSLALEDYDLIEPVERLNN